MLPSASVAVALVAALVSPVSACTNLLVSAGATADGSTLLAYNADSGNLYGSLGVYPATEHAPNATREVWDWDDSVFLGVIPEAARTFNVIGNANEHGLVMGETTFGGLPELDAHGTGGVMDYGSLIWIALQRCKTCACAIELIDALVQEHGYASDGESFSCADGTEAWLMELIGKGAYEKGAVWVATRVPEGAVLAHANQARTTTFARDDPKNVRFSNDVVSFARKIGRYPADAPDSSFDFTAAYDPVTFGGARHGEARVWDLYRRLVGDEAMTPYLEYAKGFDVTKRMPLFVFPAAPEPNTAAKLRVADVIRLMRARLEDSWFDPRGLLRADVRRRAGHSAYRARPLTWRDEASGRTFANERTVSTQQTAWTFVAASRAWMPAPARAIQWWAPDDSGTSLRVPVYGGATRAPFHFADAVGQAPGAAVDVALGVDAPVADALNPSLESAFWVWNLVSSMAYGERAGDVAPMLSREMERWQARLLRDAEAADARFSSTRVDAERTELTEAVTAFVEKAADDAFHAWRDVFLRLFAATRDGFAFGAPRARRCPPAPRTPGGARRGLVPSAREVGYDARWRARVAADGDNAAHYEVPEEKAEDEDAAPRRGGARGVETRAHGKEAAGPRLFPRVSFRVPFPFGARARVAMNRVFVCFCVCVTMAHRRFGCRVSLRVAAGALRRVFFYARRRFRESCHRRSPRRSRPSRGLVQLAEPPAL